MPYEIETEAPIPPRTRKSKYPFDQLNPGQSFFVPGLKSTQSARIANRALAPKQFTARPVDGGVRFWRTA